MNPSEIINELKKHIYERYGYHVGNNESLLKSGLIQSIDFILLIDFIEEISGIQITEQELQENHYETVKSITNFITMKLSKVVCQK